METAFRDRRQAGSLLARALTVYAGGDALVLALPRGGVPVGYEIAVRLDAELDVLVVRKLGVPGHEELAMGAIATGGIRIVDPHTIALMRVSEDALESVVDRETEELARRERAFRDDQPTPAIAHRLVILVDDGLATGSTMAAAIQAVRTQRPERLVVAVPVAAPETCRALRNYVDEMVCLMTPLHLRAIGLWYGDFSPTSDEEVRALLDHAARQRARRRHGGDYDRRTHPS